MNIVLSTISTLQNPKELQKLNHNVYIITEGLKNQPAEIIIDGITIYRPCRVPLISKLLSHPLAIRKLQKEKKISIDIIHSFSASPIFALNTFFCKLFAKKAKIIHTLKSYSRDKKGNRGNIFLKLADQVTVPTRIHAQKLNLPPQKIKVVHSPVNILKFKPKDKRKLKEKYHYQEKKVILYYGALWDNKGVDNLIRTIPILTQHKENKNFHFLFLPRYTKIQPQLQLVKELDVEKYTNFITNDIIIEDYVNLAEVVVLPYKNLLGTEGNPSCLLEALACKTPVVTTQLPELQELFDKCTIMAIPDNILSLAEKIGVSLTKNNQEIIENGFQMVQSFDQGKIARDFIKIYEELITNHLLS